jgi:hypothetical protein
MERERKNVKNIKRYSNYKFIKLNFINMEKGRPNFKFNLDKINRKIIETDESQATERISNNSNTSRSFINFEVLTKNNESDYDSIIHSIMFKFSDKTFISYDLKTAVKAYPSITSQIDNKKLLLQEITIIIPEWISSQNLKEYFHYINDDVDDFTMSVRKLLFIAEFFDNKEIIEKIVKNDIIPNINREDCLIFLEDSYKKLKSKTQDNEIWFDLFYTSLNAFVINFQYFLENEFEKIILINKDILEETIEM